MHLRNQNEKLVGFNMRVMDINLLIQGDWINRKPSAVEVEANRENKRCIKAWEKYYKECLKRGIPSNPCKRF